MLKTRRTRLGFDTLDERINPAVALDAVPIGILNALWQGVSAAKLGPAAPVLPAGTITSQTAGTVTFQGAFTGDLPDVSGTIRETTTRTAIDLTGGGTMGLEVTVDIGKGIDAGTGATYYLYAITVSTTTDIGGGNVTNGGYYYSCVVGVGQAPDYYYFG